MFKLDSNFVSEYKKANKPKFGFNGLGELTFYRTYSRIKENGKNEDWGECIERVVNTTYNIQKRHIEQNRLRWNEIKAQRSAQEMFRRIYDMKFMPPGRGFWAMKPDLIEKVGGAALNNCGFVSTDDIGSNIVEATKPFEFLMDMSMLGVGIGFDVKGAGKVVINERLSNTTVSQVTIEDTREGWVDSVKQLLSIYFDENTQHNSINFDYSLIRAKGQPIKTFGGVASGPEPLKKLHENILAVLEPLRGLPITETAIVDIMNMIGVCVVAGNVRRTAEIVFGSSEEFMDLKNYALNPQRAMYGWTSNNSIFAELGQDYTEAAKRTERNGEPGYEWLENAQSYSRMCDAPDFKDIKAAGGNPLS